MWRFKPFSQRGTLQELESGKVLLENWLQQLKVRMTRWRVPQNIWKNIPTNSHIQLELDHTSVCYMQYDNSNAKTINYYPSVDQIFQELSQHARTKIPVPTVANQIDFLIEEPLIDQEKEEDYELNLYISTFVSEETLVEHIVQLQITIKPPIAKRAEPQIIEPQPKQQVIPLAVESVVLNQEPTGEIEPENPKYAITKGIIQKLAKEIAAARKKIKTQEQQQGKGTRKLIIAESLADED